MSRPLERSGLEDPRVLAVLKDERAAAAYTVTDLAVTFDNVDDEVFEQAWVVLELSAPEAPEPPIAWSMLPDTLSSPTETTAAVEVKADLKLVSMGSSLARKVSGQATFLEALNILRSDPTWEFTRSDQHDIRGSHRLITITRSSVDSEVMGEISIIVSVRRRHWGIFPYRVQLGDHRCHRFVLKPGSAPAE